MGKIIRIALAVALAFVIMFAFTMSLSWAVYIMTDDTSKTRELWQ